MELDPPCPDDNFILACVFLILGVKEEERRLMLCLVSLVAELFYHVVRCSLVAMIIICSDRDNFRKTREENLHPRCNWSSLFLNRVQKYLYKYCIYSINVPDIPLSKPFTLDS